MNRNKRIKLMPYVYEVDRIKLVEIRLVRHRVAGTRLCLELNENIYMFYDRILAIIII